MLAVRGGDCVRIRKLARQHRFFMSISGGAARRGQQASEQVSTDRGVAGRGRHAALLPGSARAPFVSQDYVTWGGVSDPGHGRAMAGPCMPRLLPLALGRGAAVRRRGGTAAAGGATGRGQAA